MHTWRYPGVPTMLATASHKNWSLAMAESLKDDVMLSPVTSATMLEDRTLFAAEPMVSRAWILNVAEVAAVTYELTSTTVATYGIFGPGYPKAPVGDTTQVKESKIVAIVYLLTDYSLWNGPKILTSSRLR